MLSLATTPIKSVKFTLHPRNYTLLYNKLQSVLTKDQAIFFARPDIYANNVQWSVDLEKSAVIGGVKNFSQLSDSEKDNIADTIEKLKSDITRSFENIPEFKSIGDEFFRVPSETDIKIIQIDQRMMPVLTQWGCRNNDNASGIDPISFIMRRPRANTAPVLIEAFYTDNLPAINKEFVIAYLNVETTEQTDSKGFYDRGRCKLGSRLQVFTIDNHEKKCLEDFTVTENGKYQVYFPIYVNGTIRVLDTEEQPQYEYPVLVKQEESQEGYQTDEYGTITLTSIEVGKSLTITDGKDANNFQTQGIQKEKNEWTLVIKKHIPKFVKVRFTDHKKKPLQAVPVDFIYNGQSTKSITDDEGFCRLPYEGFVDGEKVKTIIHLPQKTGKVKK